MASIDQKTLSLSPGQRIELYDLDLTPVGGPLLRFTPAREDVTPATVTQFDNVNASYNHTAFDLTPYVSQGDVIRFDGYMRVVGASNTCFALSLSDSPNWSAPYSRLLFNPHGYLTAYRSNTPPVTLETQAISPASEWAYFSGGGTITSALSEYWAVLHPVALLDDDWFTYSPQAGTAQFFGLRLLRKEGSVWVPIVEFSDFGNWANQNPHNLHITDEPNVAEAVKVPIWQGNAYSPIPIQAEGFDKTGNGPFPKPTLRMSNITGAGSEIMQAYGDIRGCSVTRHRTYSDFLDNGVDPDPMAAYQPDVFYINRRSAQNSQILEIELASKLDQSGVKLPKRQIVRDVCPWKYRVWNGTSFDYATTDDACPYVGTSYFDMNGNPVSDPSEDKCSHRLETGCLKRFTGGATVPFGAFPSVGKLRA